MYKCFIGKKNTFQSIHNFIFLKVTRLGTSFQSRVMTWAPFLAWQVWEIALKDKKF